jgi:threonine/homoserine/homoserine lactone efflux protein
MTYTHNLWIFSVLLFGIIIVPGINMFFVIANAFTGDRARGLMATAGVMLGLITIVTQGLVYGGLGVAAAKSRDFLTGYPRVTTRIGRGAGAMFLAVAAWTVVKVGVG